MFVYANDIIVYFGNFSNYDAAVIGKKIYVTEGWKWPLKLYSVAASIILN